MPGRIDESVPFRALRIAVPETCTETRIEFRIGDEVASVDGRSIRAGSIADADAVVVADPTGFYRLFVYREIGSVTIEGDPGAVEAMLDTLPPVRLEAAAS